MSRARTLLVGIFLVAAFIILTLIHMTDVLAFHQKVKDSLGKGISSRNVLSFLKGPRNSPYYLDTILIDGKPTNIYNISKRADLDQELDNMRLPPIDFHPDYKNPCWYEPLPEGELYDDGNILTSIFKSLVYHIRRSTSHFTSRPPGELWRLRCLPYYYIIGVSKCGTSDLNTIISKHHDVIGPPKKEVTFWNRLRYTAPQLEQNPSILKNLKYLKTRITWPLQHYLDVYDWNSIRIKGKVNKSNGLHTLITGDATPNYIWHFDGWRKVAANRGQEEPKVILAHLIKELTPMARIIVMIRDPIQRLWSEYNFFKKGDKKSPKLFHEKVKEAMDVWYNCTSHHTPKYCAYDEYTNSQTFPVRLRLGLYYIFIQDWKEVFGDQFLLLRLEDYAESRSSVTDELFDFLGLDPLPDDEVDKVSVRNSNKKGKDSYMLQKTERMVAEFYRPWNEKLWRLMDNKKFNYNPS